MEEEYSGIDIKFLEFLEQPLNVKANFISDFNDDVSIKLDFLLASEINSQVIEDRFTCCHFKHDPNQ